MEPTTNLPNQGGPRGEWRLPAESRELIRRLFAESQGERWHLSSHSFQAALTRSAAKRFGEATASLERIQGYFATLHLQDLALACACAEGLEKAWNEFVVQYRPYLRAAAGAILRRSGDDPLAIELADSLFADLYGLTGGKAGGRSLFRYFHGRSSLKTWLRAVLSQRHIDAVRAGKKFNSLDGQEPDSEARRVPEPATAGQVVDPHRELYLQRFREALTLALASLPPSDSARLRLYYAEDRTLAEIGRELGEHESSSSRHLERVRKELRATVEGLLGAGRTAENGGPASAGMDGAQIALCIQYAAEDAAIDLDKLFESRDAKKPAGPDRSLEP